MIMAGLTAMGDIRFGSHCGCPDCDQLRYDALKAAFIAMETEREQEVLSGGKVIARFE